MRAKMMPAQVDQLAPNLRGRQGKEITRRRGLYLVQGPVQPHQRVLENIVRFFPAPQARETAEHLSGQAAHSLAGMRDQLTNGGVISVVYASHQTLNLSAIRQMVHETSLFLEPLSYFRPGARLSKQEGGSKNTRTGNPGCEVDTLSLAHF